MATSQLALGTAKAPSASQVDDLQKFLEQFNQQELQLVHNFAPGLYIRSLVEIPKGTVIVGKAHAEESIFILSKGKMMLYAAGGEMVEVEAPFQAITQPGKKVGYTLEVCTVSNVHITALTDLAELEKALIVPDPVLALPETPPAIEG